VAEVGANTQGPTHPHDKQGRLPEPCLQIGQTHMRPSSPPERENGLWSEADDRDKGSFYRFGGGECESLRGKMHGSSSYPALAAGADLGVTVDLGSGGGLRGYLSVPYLE
jgi:hypothetical protein